MSRLVFYTNKYASGEIRGRQMAAAVGAVVDADTVYPDDVLVMIKGIPPQEIIDYVKKVYVDVDDGYGLIPLLKERSKAQPIAASRVGQKYLEEQLGRKVLMIPGHHCNFERTVRVTHKVATAGFMGYPEHLHLDPVDLSDALGKIGINFVTKTKFSSREEVCDFWRGIDVQICFRKKSDTNPVPELRDPLKLINASSFGVPTIAYPEPTYADEFGGYFYEAYSLDDIVRHCKALASNGWAYHSVSMALIQYAEQYHIQHIAPLFRRLADEA